MPLSPEEALKQYYEKRESAPEPPPRITGPLADGPKYLYVAEDGETIEAGGPYNFFVPKEGKMYALKGLITDITPA